MKFRILTIVILLISSISFGQNSKSVDTTIDQLQVPSSPAFNLLGIAPDNIERPKSPTDFAISLGTASNGFTNIPKTYALEFAPFWIFRDKKFSNDEFKSDNVKNNIMQTMIFSVGTNAEKSIIDSLEHRKIGFALKFSICRGKPGGDFAKWSDSVSKYLQLIEDRKFVSKYDDSIKPLQNDLQKFKDNPEKKKEIEGKIAAIGNYFDKQDSIYEDLSNCSKNMKTLLSRTDFNRYGFKADYAIGTVFDYPDSVFGTCYASKVSTWLTWGWETENNGNLLFLARYSENINRWFLNDSNKVVENINIGELDFGVKIYKDFTPKLTFSFEYLKRIPVFNKTKLSENYIHTPNVTDRYVFTANYKVGKNQNLAFTYGKNFDNYFYKQGNLVMALNFMVGLGSIRPIAGIK